MRLSEAIRLGAMLRPQGFGELFTRHGDQIASCAFGAADEALTVEEPDASHDDAEISPVYRLYPFVSWMHVDCPACVRRRWRAEPVESIVHHLNDDHRWTREAIADWVATIEPPETPQETERTSLSAALDPVVGTQA